MVASEVPVRSKFELKPIEEEKGKESGGRKKCC